jgi:L-threonylcarbamoyladenylate synthase
VEKVEQSHATERLQGNSAADVARAAEILLRGGLVAMPTETVYGLAANALDAAAVERIFAAKQRPHWDPLIVHIAGEVTAEDVVSHVPPAARVLMDALWPGPLTLLLPRLQALPTMVTAGRDLVGVRMPAHPVAQALIIAAGVPLAAPSANRFGHISPTTAAHVLADLDGRIDAVLDAGPCSVGVESTVFDPAARVIYRQGGISQHQLEHLLGESVTVHEPHDTNAEHPESLPSPGVGIRHYAPRAHVLLVEDEAAMRERLAEFGLFGAGVMLPQGWAVPGFRGAVFSWERLDDPAALARTLYVGLRELDVRGVEAIVCALPPSSHEPLVEAIRDRLMKAARAH